MTARIKQIGQAYFCTDGCLCQSSLPADRRHRRRLHGPSCGSLMQRLQSIAEAPLEHLQETADTNASLCSSCEGQIKSIDAQEMTITDIKLRLQMSRV